VAACRPSQIILKRENHESNLQGIPFRETVSRQTRFPQRAVSRFQIKDLGILHGRQNYLSKELGVKVTLRVASDYTAVIEGQKNKQIHIGFYGPGSYARANTVSGGNVVPFVTTKNSDGSIGYYSVMYVRADSKYKSIEDLKGTTLGFVDVESTSGFKAPNFFLTQQGFPIDKYFKLGQTTGSHENAVLALAAGTVDAAVNSGTLKTIQT
jgi:phosphate/phosphite/phosphonate ABC transporter binding protein